MFSGKELSDFDAGRHVPAGIRATLIDGDLCVNVFDLTLLIEEPEKIPGRPTPELSALREHLEILDRAVRADEAEEALAHHPFD